MLPVLLLTACGQFVPADQSAPSAESSFAAEVDLPTRDDLAEVDRLNHYSQDGLLRFHTADLTWGGGLARGVDYSGLLASVEARVTLADSLATLGSVDPAALATPDERLAFWLNLYNVWVLQGVLDTLAETPDYPGVESDDFRLFNTAFVQVGGRELTLNQVEHCVVRGDPQSFSLYVEDEETEAELWGWHDSLWEGGPVDARIHVGLNCASLSCPDLLDGAFQPSRLSEQLDEAAARFLAHPEKGAGPAGISTLFRWFDGDFEASHGGAASFIETHRIGGLDGVDLSATLPYDWSLNRLD